MKRQSSNDNDASSKRQRSEENDSADALAALFEDEGANDGGPPLEEEKKQAACFNPFLALLDIENSAAEVELAFHPQPRREIEHIIREISCDGSSPHENIPIRLQSYVLDEDDAEFVASENENEVFPPEEEEDTAAVDQRNILEGGLRRSRRSRKYAFTMRSPPSDNELDEFERLADELDSEEDDEGDMSDVESQSGQVLDIQDQRMEAHERALEELDAEFVPEEDEDDEGDEGDEDSESVNDDENSDSESLTE
jgi:hypothetical protein